MDPRKSILTALVLLVLPLRAEIPPQEARGLYGHTDPVHRNLSPLWGMAALESGYLANLRFFGAYGSVPDPRFPRHPALEKIPQDNCPLDATAAVIQYLFPSPDGDNFVLNERGKDPIGAIAREQARHRQVPGTLGGLRKITALLDATTHYRQELSLHPGAAPVASQTFRADVGRILGHEPEGRKPAVASLRQRFAALLQEAAWDETRHPGGIYPPDIVEVALLAYAWKAADHVSELYEALTPLLRRPEGPLPVYDAAYHEAHADALWERMGADGPGPAPSPEEVLLLLFGCETFQIRSLPSLVTYAMAQYKGSTYPDCGETSLRNFFNIVLSRKGAIARETLEAFLARCAGPREEHKGLDPAPAGLGLLAHYYRHHGRIAGQFSREARNAWSEVVSNRNAPGADPLPIVYGAKDHNLSAKPGLENMLNLIAHLLPLPALNRPWPLDPGARFAEADRKLDALCTLVSEEGFTVDWSAGGEKRVKSAHPTLAFSINGRPAFAWTFAVHHYNMAALSELPDLGHRSDAVAARGGFFAQAWLRRLTPPLDFFSFEVPPEEGFALTSLSEALGMNLRDPNSALHMVNRLLVSDPALARAPTLPLVLSRSILPDMNSAMVLTNALELRRDLREDRAFYPMPALLRWPQSVKDHILNAAVFGDVHTMRLILDHGADVNARLPDVETTPVIFQALHFYVGGTGDTPLSVLLATRPRLNLDVIGPEGNTPLTRAIRSPLGPEMLLAAGADPNFQGPCGSPLGVAILALEDHPFEVLLEAGADPFRKDALGRTPVDLARGIHFLRPGFLDTLERLFPERFKDPEAKSAP
ncbi:ankyrin repeat domain-containing protein [Mesoterricola silvestris]|uniref:Ankyrin repeat protein n=1 Tax=Mesoterricola silvestris TaxID=2927979 RepID=A0AA48GXD4_9BACT|nr:hypothetical protein [Mesoterricola silvestris]BDU73621.1 hypothetical protein METEAL_27950 [Mesoterricola silvestris]